MAESITRAMPLWAETRVGPCLVRVRWVASEAPEQLHIPLAVPKAKEAVADASPVEVKDAS